MKKIGTLIIAIYGLTFIQIKAQSGNYFSAPQNCYVEVYNFSNLASLQTGTISFWFKIKDLSHSNTLFSESNKLAIGSNSDFYIAYRTDHHVIQTVAIVNGIVKMDAWTPYNSVNDTAWHNYTLVSDNSANTQVYIDGVAQAITAGTCCGGTLADYFLGDIPGVNNMKIGALERDIMYYSYSFAMDDLRIWNTALTASNVVALVNNTIPASGNVLLYYSFDQAEDLAVGNTGLNDVADQTNNFQNGDMVNNCNIIEENSNGSWVNHYFESPQNCYIEVYNYSDLASLQTGTISFWFKIKDLSQGNTLFSESNKLPIGSNSDFYIAFRADHHVIQTAAIVNGVVKMDAWTPYNSVNDTAWHNYTLVSDNSANTQVYIDGVAQAITAGTCCGGTLADYFLGDIPGVNNMKIGALERDIMYYSHSFAMDNFRIWNVALSNSEITTLVTQGVPALGNILMYYPFEQLENLNIGNVGLNDVADATNFSHNGDLASNCEIVAGVENNIAPITAPSVIAFPNPASTYLQLDFVVHQVDNLTIRILDQLGRVCLSKYQKVNGQYSEQLDLSSLTNGCYTVWVRGTDFSAHSKFIKVN